MLDSYAILGTSILLMWPLVIYILALHLNPSRRLSTQDATKSMSDDVVPASRFHELLEQFRILEGMPDYKQLVDEKYLNRGYFEFGYNAEFDEFDVLVWSGYFSRNECEAIYQFLEEGHGFALDIPPQTNGEILSGIDNESGLYYAMRFLSEELPTGEIYRHTQVFVSPSDNECRSAVQLMRGWGRVEGGGYSHWYVEQILNNSNQQYGYNTNQQYDYHPQFQQRATQVMQQPVGSYVPPPPEYNPYGQSQGQGHMSQTGYSQARRIPVNSGGRVNFGIAGY